MSTTIRAALLLAVDLAVATAVAAQDLSPYASKDAWQLAVPGKYQHRPEFAFVEADPSLPRVLLLGDSISMCYTAEVRQRRKGVANVFRAPDNCRSTRQTVENIETYLGSVPWDVIHFNWGIHDVTHVNDAGIVAPPPEGKLQVPPDQYRRNLRRLIERLKKTEARLIWATTTPVGKKAEEQGYRWDSDVVAYNAIAAEVMTANVVEIHNLYALTKPRAEELLSDGVHPNSEGSKVFADSVTAVIRHALGEPQGKHRAPPLESLVRELLGVSDETRALLDEAQRLGLIEVAPVSLPVHPPGDCNHYGWPIATRVGDTIIVMHRRIPGHRKLGSGEPNEKMSYGIVLRSEDGGKTWSEPYDLRDCMLPKDRDRGGVVPLSHRFKFDEANESTEGYKIHLHAIGTTRDNVVVAINNHGVFRSEDKGRTWNHFSKALRDDTFPHHIVNIGPNIIDHPDHGLMMFGNWFGKLGGRRRVMSWSC